MNRIHLLYGTLCCLLAVSVIASLSLGTVPVPFTELINMLFGQSAPQYQHIVETYRAPRAVLAVAVGASLALAGAILQGIIRNPLASPDVIGLSKGAGIAAIIAIVGFPGAPPGIAPWAGFLGAAVIGFLLIGMTSIFRLGPSSLALAGLALGAMAGAGIQYMTVKHFNDANSALLWLAGSLWGSSWERASLVLPWMVVLIPLVLFQFRRLDVLTLGDDIAVGLGLLAQKSRMLLFVLAVCLTGASVAAAGTVGFVGLVAPHMARKIVGPLHKHVLPASAFIGAILVTASDIIGRLLITPREVPVGIITAVLGAPYFLYLLRKSNKN